MILPGGRALPAADMSTSSVMNRVGSPASAATDEQLLTLRIGGAAAAAAAGREDGGGAAGTLNVESCGKVHI